MHDLIQENQGPETSSLFFSGVRIVFGVEMAKLGLVGRGIRDQMRGSLPEPGLRTAGSCTCLAAPRATKTVDVQNEDRDTPFFCLRYRKRMRVTAQEAENLTGLSSQGPTGFIQAFPLPRIGDCNTLQCHSASFGNKDRPFLGKSLEPPA